MSLPLRDWDGHLGFQIDPKNTNLVEDIEIDLASCQVSSNSWPFSGFRGEVENISVNQWPGQPSLFADPHKKQKLGRGR